jgi:lipoprotein-anchoring transpeptidase ErfK/SrfK
LAALGTWREQASVRQRDKIGCANGGASALALAAVIALIAAPTPAAAAFWYGGYGPEYLPRHVHKAHKPKAVDHASKQPSSEIPKGPLQIFISINQQKLHLYSDGVHVADTSVATGVPGLPTPLGVFSVIQKQVFHRSNIYSNAPMPYMQRITWSGVAMHEGESIGHRASHGCIRMPHDFAVRLYHMTKLGTRVIVANAELKPVDFADPHLFVHKERPPETAAPPTADNADSAAIKPAELAAHADAPASTQPVLSDVQPPPADAQPAVSADPKPENTAHPADQPAAGPATATPPVPSPADLAKIAAAKKTPISIFISRKRQRLYVRQDFAPLFDTAVAIAQPEIPVGTQVFTALEFTGPDHTTFRWNVVSLPGESPKRVRYVERHDRHGHARRREIEETADPPAPQNPAQVLARVDIPPDISDAIAQMIVPGSSLIVSDQGLGDETGEGTDFIVVTR